ncbi:MAG TPA: four helix bundle protein [Bryobacteraceae bacterium]|jgi:four helix bundle protein
MRGSWDPEHFFSMASAPTPDTVRNLDIWRLGIRLVKSVYEVAGTWPKQETYGLAAQVRRAAVSVPANIAEGVGRHSHADTARFVQIALGSLYELDALFEVAAELGYSAPPDRHARLEELIRKTSAFIDYQRRAADNERR